MADRKDKPKWSKPKLSPPGLSPRRSRPTLERRSEAQRRGMAATRKKATAKRPNRPITLAELQAVRRLDKDRFQDSLMSSPVGRRARERFRMEGR